jgi:hypothetical protein
MANLSNSFGMVWVGLRIAFAGCVESRGGVLAEPRPDEFCPDEFCLDEARPDEVCQMRSAR